MVPTHNLKKVETKCISDRVLNYLHQIQNRLNLDDRYDLSERVRLWKTVFELYKDLRCEIFYGNHDPVMMAGATVLLGSVKCGIPITQKEIAEIIGRNGTSLRLGKEKIIKFIHTTKSFGFIKCSECERYYKDTHFCFKVLKRIGSEVS